ncbi:MAG: Phenolphthiocerol synthesis polyketide synthase type I Pks15/1 [Chloroflexi bacterium]|nr:Phenolphthiocerol synthesis polyketide synthase type I Pks15/1 [Chloroflexota bacterium]
MTSTPKTLSNTPIAIIGQAGIFAKAANARQYWENILNKVNGITEVPPSRWKIEDYYDPDPTAPDKTYCKVGGFIPNIDFNPLEFGLPPNFLEVTDTSQLLGLVVARDVLEDAGYGEDHDFDREGVGVVLGVSGGLKMVKPFGHRLEYPVWQKVLKSSGLSDEDTENIVEKIKLAYVEWNENAFPGLLANVVSGRIANRLDLGGMNAIVDAACASSLAAVQMAIGQLVDHRCEMMITGGVDTDNSPFTYMCFSKTPAFSKQGQIRPFDAQADGMLAGEGLGMLLLKRLEDAERDEDRIYAVIRGIGSSSDGRYKSIYAPRPSGQTLALQRAYQDAGVEPSSLGLVEAHGTGTGAGDPSELEGLKGAFNGDHAANGQYIALGSVKSQIGHTKAAAGAAGMLKAAFALYHKVLPPTINVENPNPKLALEDSPFYVNTESRPWLRSNPGMPRRAGVSAFGFGGTNFHVVLEEYEEEHEGEYRLNLGAEPVILFADTPQALVMLTEQKLANLEEEDGDGQAYAELTSQSHDLAIPRTSPRIGFVAESREEAIQMLNTALSILKKQPDSEAWEHPRGITYRAAGLETEGKVAALFPGQGSQYLNMGKELAMNFPPVREMYERMNARFVDEELKPLSEVVFPIPAFDEETQKEQSVALRATDYAQAAIGVTSAALFNLLEQAGFAPDFTAGHSFGELTALWAGGVLSDEDFLDLVKARGKAMAPPDDPDFDDTGTMLAVNGSLSRLEEEIADFEEVIIANQNSPQQVVLAGPTKAIGEVAQALEEKGFKVTPLPVSAAFHTSFVEHASVPFAAAVDKVTFQEPTRSVYSNTTGQPYPEDSAQAKEILANHILHPVLFKTQIENIYEAGGRIFVETGPRRIITSLVEEILEGKPHVAVALNSSRKKSSDRQFREAVVRLRVAGLPLEDVDPYGVKSDE